MRRAILTLLLAAALLVQHPCARAKAVRRHHHARAASVQPHPMRAAGKGHKAGRHAAALSRAKRKTLKLRPVEPLTHALIDPVPRGKFPFPSPLRGSHDSLLRQNARSQADGLERILDDADLLSLRQSRELIAIPQTSALLVDERLPANRRFCREWAAHFLGDLSRVHYGRFHKPLQVNSAVRTVAFQRQMGRKNGNAAPADGDDASPHLMGATIDIAKKGLSMSEVGWVRAYLAPLQAAGKIDVEEEFQQSCFHITVYRSYQPASSASEGKPAGSRASLLAAHLH